MKNRLLVAMLAGVAILGCGTQTAPVQEIPATLTQEDAQPEQRQTDQSVAFLEMVNEHAELFLVVAPELSTSLGMSEDIAGVNFLSRLGQYGFDAHQQARQLNETLLQDLRGFDRKRISGTAGTTYDVLKNAYETAAQRNQFDFGGATPFGGSLPNSGNAWAITPYLITQLTGPHIYLPRMLQTEHPVTNRAEAEAYVARLRDMGRVFDEVTGTVASDAATGVVPPQFTIEGVLQSITGLTAPSPSDHPLVTTLTKKMESIRTMSDVDRSALSADASDAVENIVYPAYRRLAQLFETLKSQAGPDAGIWRLGPEGEAFYDMALRAYGAGDMDGDQVHQIGLAEVKRISQEMNTLLEELDLADGSVADRMKVIATREDNLFPNTDDGRDNLLQSLRDQVDAINEIAPQWFGRLPKTTVAVRRIPVYEQDSSPGGYYSGPSLDGTRPGSYWINLKDTSDNPKHSLPTLTYHEAVPGHHFQISLQREIEDMPLIRNMLSYSEYTEGWALYAEKLASEMGVYNDDPYGDLGRLQAELFRAARLVVDSGLHTKRWTREQAIHYMVSTTGETPASVTREIERYAAIPGQACSYKLGMIRIGALRQKAENELGDAFDIRAFHDQVLSLGAVPLPVLEDAIDRWIAEQRGRL